MANEVQGVLMLAALAGGGYLYLTADSDAKRQPELPTAQASFVKQLNDYRAQYKSAESNKNDIQKSRTVEARNAYLCQTDAGIQAWVGKVYRVDSSNQSASVYIQISDHVWLRGETIESQKQPELFEAIARLKAGDQLRVSGKLQRNKDCVKEVSITESGGIDTPEFRLAYTDINGAQRRGEAPSAEPEKKEKLPPPTPKSGQEVSQDFFQHISGQMAYQCQEAIKGLVKNDIRAPGILYGTSSSRDMTFLLRMSRWSGKVSPNNTILIAGDEAEAQNGLGNWLRVNYTCTVDLSNNTVKHATLNQGRLQ